MYLNQINKNLNHKLTTPIPSKANMAVPKKKGNFRHVEAYGRRLGSLTSYGQSQRW